MKKRRSRSTAHTAMRNAATALKAGEAVGAAAAVIAARTELAALACSQPSAAHNAEMGLMVTEKVHAFSEAGAAVAAGAADLAGRGARYAAHEMQVAGQGLVQLAACRTPAELMAVQARLMTGFLGRAHAYGLGVNAAAAKTGERALAPVHKAVTENKARLGKKG